MKKVNIILICLSMSFLAGCTALIGKGVDLGGSVTGFKASVTANPETGSLAPDVGVGWGSFYYHDKPMRKNGAWLYYKENYSSLPYSSALSDKLIIYCFDGDGDFDIPDSTVTSKCMVKPNQIVPGIFVGGTNATVILKKETNGKIVTATASIDSFGTPSASTNVDTSSSNTK